ncbi:MAG: UDP-2,3-diacylglucosamine diphosphatase LpxI [Pseudomonadota bacterium]
MERRLAIIACGGSLPVLIQQAHPGAMVITLAGVESEIETISNPHRLEEIGVLFTSMKTDGVTDVIFAGSLSRPKLNPMLFDGEMQAIAPRLVQAMSLGDDGLLRTVIDIFEEQGFHVLGVGDLMPHLVAGADLALGGKTSDQDEADITRAVAILRGISDLDIGQGCAVAAGQCLGIETVQGTDALLRFVSETPEHYRAGGRGGVYVKAAKTGQDLRMDMPAIGPATVKAVAQAGLSGMVVEADRVLILDRFATLQTAKDAGIFLQARAL